MCRMFDSPCNGPPNLWIYFSRFCIDLFVALSHFIWLNLHFLIFKFQVIGALTADKMRWSWICIVLKLMTRYPIIHCLRYTYPYCTWSLELNKAPGCTINALGNRYIYWYKLTKCCWVLDMLYLPFNALMRGHTLTYLNREGISYRDWCIC